MAFFPNANTVYRDYEADGIPSSGEHDPKKSDIRTLLTTYETIIDAFTSNGGLIYSSKAALEADLAHAANTMAWVVGDATTANNGIYQKSGASGSGSWTRVADLPYPFIPASDVGAGTPNAILATTNIPVSESALIWVDLFEANTASPVTISFNGGAALTIKTNTNNDPVAGGLSGVLLGRIRGTTFRLISDQASAAIVAAAEAAAAAAEAAANSNYTFDTVAQAAAASIPAAINSIFVRGRDAADDGVISVYVDTDSGSTDTFESSGGDARTWYLVEEAPKVRYAVGLPWVSVMENLRMLGMAPQWVDNGNEIGNDADAAIPIREMFAQGIGDGFTKFRLPSGKTYNIASPDPLGTGAQEDSIGVFLGSVAGDITLDMRGAVVKGFDTIRTNPSNPGAMFWFTSADTTEGESEEQRFHVVGGRIDASSLTAATPGVTTIGGMSFVGRFNVFLDHVIADAGSTTPSGDAIGVGGGDQAFFFSNTAYVHALNCIVLGWPDLAYYFSNSGLRGALIEGGLIRGCQNGIGAKRFSSLIRALGVHFKLCDIGIYNPVADDLTNNMGGRLYVDSCLFEKIQSRPIDINALANGSVVQNNRVYDWGRRISDGAENSLSERLAACRIRSANCQIQGNHFELRDWSLTSTSGKEQVGLIFGFNGSVSAGADDCFHSDNYYKGLYQKVRYDASTARNRGENERGVSISVSDTDGADNIFPHRMLDDTMVTFVPSSNRSVIQIEAQTTSAGSPNIMVHCNTTGSPAIANYPSGMATPANISLATAITTVAGATDGNFTISTVSDGTVRLINRTGGTLLLRVSELSR